jgi:hypothetical protein
VAQASADGSPAWVCKRDGRLEPFDADKICQALYAATEAVGAPNAFLARELTDAVVHFLGADAGESPPTTESIGEQVIKVVRELGQPVLAQAYAERGRHMKPAPGTTPQKTFTLLYSTEESPETVARRCMRSYAERAVFSRDLIAAMGDGLIVLAGLESPRALASCVVETPPEGWASFWDELPGWCAAAGQGLVIDGPEWDSFGADGSAQNGGRRPWPMSLPALTARQVTVNVNASQPPAWARRRDPGPLFTEGPVPAEPTSGLLDAILDLGPEIAVRPLRWDWHIQSRDFASAPHRQRLAQMARRALEGCPVAFVFDRPRRPVALAEGIDRQGAAVLMEVGLNLERFLDLPAVAGSVEAFRDKLPSLVRMAVSAGTQKRKYLRRHAAGTRLERGFLLDRARLVLVPISLDSVIRRFTGQGLVAGGASLDLGREIVMLLQDHLHTVARGAHLEACIDSPGPGISRSSEPVMRPDSGLSVTDARASPAQQLAAAGALHAVAGQGTACVELLAVAEPSGDELLELLHFAWKRTELLRVAFFRSPDPVTQRRFDDL